MKVVREIKQNDNLYSLYNIVEMLYHHYYSTNIPKDVLEELKKLYDYLYEEITKDYVPSLNITNTDLIERITFEGKKEEYEFPKEKISYYDLITMYKDRLPLPQTIRIELGKYEVEYVRKDDIDGEFNYYEIKNESEINESLGIMGFLRDSISDSSCLEKCIEILD